jgi:hypothetical protein
MFLQFAFSIVELLRLVDTRVQVDDNIDGGHQDLGCN